MLQKAAITQKLTLRKYSNSLSAKVIASKYTRYMVHTVPSPTLLQKHTINESIELDGFVHIVGASKHTYMTCTCTYALL